MIYKAVNLFCYSPNRKWEFPRLSFHICNRLQGSRHN